MSPVPMELATKAMKHGKHFKWTNKELAGQFDKLSRKMNVKPNPVKGKINKLFAEKEAKKVSKWDQLSKQYETTNSEKPHRPMTKQA